MTKILLSLLFICSNLYCLAQEEAITITDDKRSNRLFLYASNTSETDLDVTLEVNGTGFKQSNRKPRAYRVPAASKVEMISLVIERGKTPVYSYDLKITDSLSRRAMIKPSTPIKIEPNIPILVYITENCISCEALMVKLDSSYYMYRSMVLAEKPEIKETIVNVFAKTATPYETITNPIISLGGTLYSEIDTYDKLLEKLNSN